jgi:hypothetical protein
LGKNIPDRRNSRGGLELRMTWGMFWEQEHNVEGLSGSDMNESRSQKAFWIKVRSRKWSFSKMEATNHKMAFTRERCALIDVRKASATF